MRRYLSMVILTAAAGIFCMPQSQAEQAPKARTKCDILCDNLAIAIQQHPDNLVMRLEDALVINERCAGEIVNAAITAVDGNPKLVDQIIKTALHVAPNRARIILYSANHYVPKAPAAILMEEVRKAEIPTRLAANTSGAVEEIRRAEPANAQASAPTEEIRKAVVAGPAATAGVVVMDTAASVGSASAATPPVEEIRKAEPVSPNRASVVGKLGSAGKPEAGKN